jgi:hypothetical protein
MEKEKMKYETDYVETESTSFLSFPVHGSNLPPFFTVCLHIFIIFDWERPLRVSKHIS